MASMLPAFLQIEVNWLRGLYIALFFCNAIFATLFKTIGRGEWGRCKVASSISIAKTHLFRLIRLAVFVRHVLRL